ncbi:hypothetical protein B0H34DRAFT_719555 [Crassisporium funariophilum]|nr:hypothetical protein B0H34DRAFT_719555 [Crassisporium funariophilum]
MEAHNSNPSHSRSSTSAGYLHQDIQQPVSTRARSPQYEGCLPLAEHHNLPPRHSRPNPAASSSGRSYSPPAGQLQSTSRRSHSPARYPQSSAAQGTVNNSQHHEDSCCRTQQTQSCAMFSPSPPPRNLGQRR